MNSTTSTEAVALYAPDSPELASLARSWKSAYVHIPFCLRRCPYCDFAIVDGSSEPRDLVGRYVDAVLAEIEMQASLGPLDAVNFGGGTPSRLAAHQLGSILAALRARFGLVDGCEISLEANPEDWTEAMAKSLVAHGFTRVSLGVQSFDDQVLQALGRAHSVHQAEDAVAAARAAGFASVSVDLIFGHPAESDASWSETVNRALACGPDHVSTYSLTVEAGTALAVEVAAGSTAAPDDDVQANRYDTFSGRAQSDGIVRYEVSNHARTGHACRYNLATWANADYFGFGMAAHDHVGRMRSRNFQTIDRYMTAVESGQRPRAGTERLTDIELARDSMMLGLRLAAGIPIEGLAETFAASDIGQQLQTAGIVAQRAGRLVVTDPMRSDSVIREALSVSAGDC